MKDFNWNDLKFFVAVARTGTPNAAARLLRVDHNTVRRRVSALETDLGARLFDRREEHLSLTDEGEKLFSLAESIESSAASVHSEISGRDVAIAGTVRIGVSDGLGTMFIAPRLATLRDAHPELQVELVVTSRHFNLSKREADIALIIGRPVEGTATIKKLIDVTVRLHASKEYLSRMPPIKKLSDLREHDFIGGVDDLDFGSGLNKILAESGAPVEPKMRCTSSVAQMKAAGAGSGLCFFADFMVVDDPRLERVLGDSVLQSREIWLAVHTHLKDLARMRAVVKFLVQEFAAARALFD